MKITIRENKIEIEYRDDELLPKLYSQFSFYGFTKYDGRSLIYTGPDYKDIAIKVALYLEKNDQIIEYDKRLLQLIEDNTRKSNGFVTLKEKAITYKNGIFDNRDFSEFNVFIKNNIKRILKPHQIKSAYHQYILNNSANFSVPGSGKTSTILTVYEKLRCEGKVNFLYVVGPTSCFTAWKAEAHETLKRGIKIKVLSGGDKEDRLRTYYNIYNNAELIITSYQTFSNDLEHVLKFLSHNDVHVLLVLDEAHYIKQIGGVWAKSALSASKHSNYKALLTGTPCPRSYIDLFNMFDILYGTDTAISKTEKHKIQLYARNNNYNQASILLKSCIDPLFYRVRKKDLCLLEQVFHSPISIDMNYHERILYNAIFSKIRDISKFDINRNIATLLKLRKSRIIRLRQLTSYAGLLSSIFDETYNDIKINDDLKKIILEYDKLECPAKIKALIELIKRIQKNEKKILVWSNFISSIELIERHLRKSNIKCNHIYGKTPIINIDDQDILSREQIINEFLTEESSIDVLIANPAACAESISMHKGCYNAIYYDLSYNCAQYLQSLDRIHRIGGSEFKVANYYFLQYNDTIDTDILNNLETKRDAMYQIIETDSDIYRLNTDVFEDIDDDIIAYKRIFNI
jgi:SNF2 family DNA or RNA helicase